MLQLLEGRGSTSVICINGLYQLILLHRFVPSPPDLPCSRIILSVTSLPDSIKSSRASLVISALPLCSVIQLYNTSHDNLTSLL